MSCSCATKNPTRPPPASQNRYIQLRATCVLHRFLGRAPRRTAFELDTFSIYNMQRPIQRMLQKLGPRKGSALDRSQSGRRRGLGPACRCQDAFGSSLDRVEFEGAPQPLGSLQLRLARERGDVPKDISRRSSARVSDKARRKWFFFLQSSPSTAVTGCTRRGSRGPGPRTRAHILVKPCYA